jgi:hypothetical protein
MGPSCGCPSRWEGDVPGLELGSQSVEQLAVLLVDGADPAEREVVVRHLLEALARDAAAAGDVLEERHHVVGTLRAPERDEEEGVVRERHESTSTTSAASIRRPV